MTTPSNDAYQTAINTYLESAHGKDTSAEVVLRMRSMSPVGLLEGAHPTLAQLHNLRTAFDDLLRIEGEVDDDEVEVSELNSSLEAVRSARCVAR